MRFCQNIKNYLLTAFFCVFLTACIIVGDIGVYWEKGIVDPSLEGAWSKDGGKDCHEFVLDGKNYQGVENGKKEESIYRTLVIGNHKFFMIKNPDNEYWLIKYQISADDLTTYMLNSAKKSDFLRDYSDSNIVVFGSNSSTVTIPHLNEKSFALLEKIADDKTYWKDILVEHRVKECKVSDAKQ